MEMCKKEGRTFDVIFGDLTELPISSEQQGEIWQFFRKALNLAFSVLKSDGSYLTHANGASSQDNLKLFEKTIRETLEFPLDFKSSSAFVPSFHEKWIFYQIKRA
jgi:spermine synthase